jgi:hypothetical protein
MGSSAVRGSMRTTLESTFGGGLQKETFDFCNGTISADLQKLISRMRTLGIERHHTCFS